MRSRPPHIGLLLILLSFVIASHPGYAQHSDKLSLDIAFTSKISLGKPTRNVIQYDPATTVNVPARSVYNNPDYSLEAGINYHVSGGAYIGLASGISVVKFENHPIASAQYYDRVMFPLVLKAGYQNDIGKSWFYNLDLAAGQKFADFRFTNTDEGFLFLESGGLMGYASAGISKAIGKYRPFFSLGYEINQFSHENSIGWIEPFSYEDKIFYKTQYHLLRMSVGVKM